MRGLLNLSQNHVCSARARQLVPLLHPCEDVPAGCPSDNFVDALLLRHYTTATKGV